jgi:hypothetical protein
MPALLNESSQPSGLPSQQSSASPDELRGARKTRDDGLSGLPSQSVCSPQCTGPQCSTGLPSQQSSASPDELRGARKTRDDGMSGLPSQSECSPQCSTRGDMQPELPKTDYSYKAASARALIFCTLLSRLCNLDHSAEAAAASI